MLNTGKPDVKLNSAISCNRLLSNSSYCLFTMYYAPCTVVRPHRTFWSPRLTTTQTDIIIFILQKKNVRHVKYLPTVTNQWQSEDLKSNPTLWTTGQHQWCLSTYDTKRKSGWVMSGAPKASFIKLVIFPLSHHTATAHTNLWDIRISPYDDIYVKRDKTTVSKCSYRTKCKSLISSIIPPPVPSNPLNPNRLSRSKYYLQSGKYLSGSQIFQGNFGFLLAHHTWQRLFRGRTMGVKKSSHTLFVWCLNLL